MSFLFFSVYMTLPSGIVFRITLYFTILFFACKLRIDFILPRGYNYFKYHPVRPSGFPLFLRRAARQRVRGALSRPFELRRESEAFHGRRF